MIAKRPDDLNLRKARAVARFHAEDFKGCLEDFQIALDREPSFMPRTMAHCALAAGQFDRARRLYRHAIERDSDPIGQTYSAIGAVLTSERLGVPAPDARVRTLKLRSGAWPALLLDYLRGETSFEVVRLAADRHDADLTVEQDERNARTELHYYVGARLAASSGDREKAAAELEAASQPAFSANAEYVLAKAEARRLAVLAAHR